MQFCVACQLTGKTEHLNEGFKVKSVQNIQSDTS